MTKENMKKTSTKFIIRWLFNSLGLYFAVSFLGAGNYNMSLWVSVFGYLSAGLIFSIINSILKPVIIVLSLPAIALTLGMFMLVVNGLMVYLTFRISQNISVTFVNSIFIGLLMSLINYIVDMILITKIDNQRRIKK